MYLRHVYVYTDRNAYYLLYLANAAHRCGGSGGQIAWPRRAGLVASITRAGGQKQKRLEQLVAWCGGPEVLPPDPSHAALDTIVRLG
jgi:hypothetical protein